jgi:TRAP-type C4-dicarboxylate transport system substrate-binding protein
MQMKRKSVALIVVILLFALFFIGTSATAKTIQLSLSNFYPASHFMNTRVLSQWIAEVEKATEGAVKISNFPGGTLLKAPETYDGIVSGTGDIGNGVFAYTRGRFPVMEGFELPGIYFGSCAATTMVAVEGVEKFQPKELSDTKVMFLYSVGPGSLYSKKKVNALEDLQGMRIRATGLTAKSIAALGATPVAMPQPDVYESLSKGVIDGNIGPPEVLKGWKQADVTRFITIMPPVYNSIQYTVMNKATWESLPEKVRQAIDGVNASYSLKAAQEWDAQQKENGIDYGLAQGMKLDRLSQEDNDKAMALMQPLLDDYIARMNEKGLPGKEIVEFVKARAKIYSEKYPTGY